MHSDFQLNKGPIGGISFITLFWEGKALSLGTLGRVISVSSISNDISVSSSIQWQDCQSPSSSLSSSHIYIPKSVRVLGLLKQYREL